MLLYVLAALGGALGAVLRYAVGRFVQDVLDRPWFPYNTLFINVTGCFVFGLIMGWVEAGRSLTPEQRTFMLVGILGGYTTFSTFGFETVALLRDGQIVPALLNVGLQCVLGIVGVWLGMGLARVV